MAKWIKEDLSAEVGNFAIEHDEQCALAALSRRWFAMVFREWEGHWPRVQRAGFAIRSDLFKRIGGFDSRYGQFAPQVLSARLHLQGVTVKAIPGASVVHEDDECMRDHHAATSDFIRGLVKARSEMDPAFFERYFGYGPNLANYPRERHVVAHQAVRAIAVIAASDPKSALRLFSATWSLAGGYFAGLTSRIRFNKLVLAIEDTAIDWLPLPSKWRWIFFLRAHQRAARLQFLLSARSAAVRRLPVSLDRWPMEKLPPDTVIGLHALERRGGRCFRWTESILILRPKLSKHRWTEVRIETLCGNPLKRLIAVIADGRQIPLQWCTATPDGTLILRLPPRAKTSRNRMVFFVFSPLPTSNDARILGVPISSIASRSIKSPFELYGHWQDGWAAPSTIIHAFEPTTARLNLEIPPWLPFHFPVVIKANQDGRELAATKASMPGCQHLDVSVDRAGIIKLSADQWFVPSSLGISPDERQLSYRVNLGILESNRVPKGSV